MTASRPSYVHGYSDIEQIRLFDQAKTLAELLHRDTQYPSGTSVLEAGCGVGAQTVILAAGSPQARFTSIDISNESLAAAEARVRGAGYTNVAFMQADLFRLPFADAFFDHVFLCFVLEHLADPMAALGELRRVLRVGGTLTAIEGDHGSAYFHPHTEAAQRTIDCLVTLQARIGGNALIGRELHPLLRRAGFDHVEVEPRVVYADGSRSAWVEGFTKATFIAMVEGVKEQVLAAHLLSELEWDQGITELKRSAADDGTFNYTFFKGVARK
jgi:ubiquinone/menaquinone biosynthesis C-methylase UbiE